MPREIIGYQLSVRNSETGVQLTTVRTAESAELFSSIEDAVEKKDQESHIKKTLGGSIMAIGVIGFAGFTAALHASELDDVPDRAYYFIDTTFILGSVGLTLLGYKLYQGGELARSQWHKLKEFLNQVSPATNVNHPSQSS